MFSITKEDFFGTEKIKLNNLATREYLSFVPRFGGNLNELSLAKNGQIHHLLLNNEPIESEPGKNANHYNGAKLSPFPNRIKNGNYAFEEKEYQLKINKAPNAMHGLCWNLPFTIKEQNASESKAFVILQTNYNAISPGYPFTYHIEIEYVLDKKGFTCTTSIANTDKASIPIGDGWHPYFVTGSKADTIKLQLPQNKQMELKDAIPTGKYIRENLFTSPTLLNDTKLDDCFELSRTEGMVETKLIDEQKNTTIIIWQKTGKRGYNFLQVYIPADRNSIAVEPMSCAPDAFNNKNGLIVLSPSDTAMFTFGVRLE